MGETKPGQGSMTPQSDQGPGSYLRDETDTTSDRFPEGIQPEDPRPEDVRPGSNAGATDDGRRAGTPAADASTEPGQGRETPPPTAGDRDR